MKYIMLIYTNEAEDVNATPEQQAAVMEAYNQFGAEHAQKGYKFDGEALHPTNTATTVRVHDGKTLTTDGPFAETREALGGYYLFDCKDLDEAIKVAEKIPGAKGGSIEIRPVMVFE
jgi:hypothetical protein